MSLEVSKKEKRNKETANFWRALRFLGPHWKIVLASILCAFVVGGAFTSGLTTILPIVQLLIKGDSVQAWVDRQIVASRLDARLGDDPQHVVITSAKPGGPAAEAGVNYGAIERVDGEAVPAEVVNEKPGTRDQRRAAAVLRALADASRTSALIGVGFENLKWSTVKLKPVKPYYVIGSKLAGKLPNDPVKAVAAVFGLLALLACFGNFVRVFQEYLAEKSAVLAVNDVRRKLYDHALHMHISFFGVNGTSDVTSRLIQDTGGLLEGFKAVLGRAIQEPINAGLAFGLAMWLSWKLTLFIVFFAPVMVGLIDSFGRKMRKANRRALEKSSSMLGQLEGTLSGVRVVKAATAEHLERRRYRGIMQSLLRQQLKLAWLDAVSAPILESLTLLVVGVIVVVAAYMVLTTGTLGTGEFILLMGCLAAMGDSLRKLTKVNNSVQKSSAAAGRIFEMLAVPEERRRVGSGPSAVGSKKAIKLGAMRSEVRFENISFAYPGSSIPAVSGVSLVVPKGQSVAIVGRNGSGKTTLMALLPRFYEAQEGSVSIDGVDVRDATLKSLRRQMAIVTQDSVIFPGTVLENIAYGDSRLHRERAMEAAKRAFAHEFIMEKAGGYDAPLGGQGAQLSGGQKQRLCIARAIYRASPILILDEATSQVDAESEHLIQQAIEQVMHERTTFVIAHRFSTIKSADSIVVMERGQVVGQGKHEELLRMCSTYRLLYERQMITDDAASPATIAQ